MNASRLFKTTVSFGSVASLIEMPCEMSHASVPPHLRSLAADLIRVSVGIEDPSGRIFISSFYSAIDSFKFYGGKLIAKKSASQMQFLSKTTRLRGRFFGDFFFVGF